MNLIFAEAAGQGGGMLGTLIYFGFFAILIGGFYFIGIRPQQKEEKRRRALLETIEIGDSVVTTAGFYGVVIDMIEEQGIVVVEFGNNKNCRIPMKKGHIVEVEKPSK
ncbi:MAG: preprotein translocase subunit YajC [Lachnospiraceae bacterium]|nr:preprotein translocase subunit YajC [Lachnospiraceae bacterium]